MEKSYYEKAFEAILAQLNGDPDTAVIQLTNLLQEKESYDLYIAKAIALTQLNNLESAIKECENAIVIDRKRYEGRFRKGICLFMQGKIKASLIEFEESFEKTDKPILKKRIDIWIQKCKAELNNKNFDKVIDQSTSFQQQQQQQQQTQQQFQQKQDISSNKLEEQKRQQEIQIEKPQQNKVISQSGKIAYSWFQTISHLTIEIFFQIQDPTKIKSDFQEQKIDVNFPIREGQDYDLSLDLYDKIVPQNCKINVTMLKLEIVLEKKNQISWKQLEKPEEIIEQNQEGKTKEDDNNKDQKKDQVFVNIQKPSYPTSSQSKKDWSKIDHDIEQDMKKNKDDYGEGDPLNSLFKQIYEHADENTRKAMIKSFQTSGGTVLSTNWDEVKEKDYSGKDKPEPPKGQEWKKWEK